MKTFIQIGCGGWGNHWLTRMIPQMADVATCIAAVDINPIALARAGELLALPPEALYIDLAQALDEHPVDFVVIATTITSHLQVVKTVLAHGRGCHILSEKPIAGTMAECADIYQLVKKAGIKFAVTFSHRYEDDKQTLGQLLAGEQINYLVGRIIVDRKQNTGHKVVPPEWCLIDGGAHNLDMVRYFTGSNAEEVYCTAWNIDWKHGEDCSSAFVKITLQNNAHAFLEYEFGGAHTYNGWTKEYFRAECDSASFELDNRRIMKHTLSGSEEIPLLKGPHWSHNLIIHQFVEWLDGGKAPEVTIDDSIHGMGLVLAAVESSKTGKPVNVPRFMAAHGLTF